MTNQEDLETHSQWETKGWTWWEWGWRVRDTAAEGERQKEKRFMRKRGGVENEDWEKRI